MVSMPPKYKTMVADISDNDVTHIKIAAASIAGFMIGRITLKKLLMGDTPRLIEASSIESGML